MMHESPSGPNIKKLWPRETITNVKHVIAVGSGKGGVGKSTVSVQLALAAARAGRRVGLLDADIYGPSLPHMMGLGDVPDTREGNMIPLLKHGVECQSLGLIAGGQAAILRGPMVSKTLQQLARGTRWGTMSQQGEKNAALDLLIVDLPPGTGDVQLSLMQANRIDGAILVTTPQQVALIDARKAAQMFQKANVAIMGVIENMSGMTGSLAKPFGEGGGALLAQETRAPLLGTLPLDPELMQACDSGAPMLPESHAISRLMQAAVDRMPF